MSEQMILQTDALCVGYKRVPLISDIQMYVERGRLLTLIGPNGSGKSTVLKSIARQLQPIAGTAYLEKKPYREVPQSDFAKKMSVVLTTKPHGELMTCFEVASAGRYPYTGRFGILTEQDRQIVKESMQLVNAWELADCEFKKISDGQKQKVLLARALCQEPEIIILDEPTSFLDIRHKIDILNVLKKLAMEKNLAVVMSLHELELVGRYSDFLMCIHNHRISHMGTAQELFKPEIICELFDLTEEEYQTYLSV